MALLTRELSGYWSPEFVRSWLHGYGCAGPVKVRMGVQPLRDKETAEAYCMASLTAEGSEYAGMIVQFFGVPGGEDHVKWLAVWDEEACTNAPDDADGIRSARSLS